MQKGFGFFWVTKACMQLNNKKPKNIYLLIEKKKPSKL